MTTAHEMARPIKHALYRPTRVQRTTIELDHTRTEREARYATDTVRGATSMATGLSSDTDLATGTGAASDGRRGDTSANGTA